MFWDALRVELPRLGLDDLPDDLAFERPPVPTEIDTDTLFAQVCGYPLGTIYRQQATLLAAPVYAAEYCAGATHCGIFIVGRTYAFERLEDLRGCRFAYNSRHSNSGMNLPRRSIADIAPREGVFRRDRGDAQPSRQHRARGPRRDRRNLRGLRHVRVCRPIPTPPGGSNAGGGDDVSEPIDSVCRLRRRGRRAEGRLGQCTFSRGAGGRMVACARGTYAAGHRAGRRCIGLREPAPIRIRGTRAWLSGASVRRARLQASLRG
jgi:hypothetical protein